MAAGKDLQENRSHILTEIATTQDIQIPQDPLERVIGQEEAVSLARVAAIQRRNLLLVGPPGVGKSMIARALALHLPPPTQELRVVHNPENPERPTVEIKRGEDAETERSTKEYAGGEIIDPAEAPITVAERLGYRCRSCGTYSSPREIYCPKCQKSKMLGTFAGQGNPFSDIFGNLFEITMGQGLGTDRVTTTRKRFDKEEVVVYERFGDNIRVLDQKALEKRRAIEKQSPHKVIVPYRRNNFVMVAGSSETELLGDVRHDPYGGHSQLGTQPYERVIPGAVHEAHEGVLYIDELPHLGELQRYILTAMQDKVFPIEGHNPQSAGAAVRVDSVPCDFILVASCNIQDLQQIISPLRSRIVGSGYEVLLETTMKDTEENRDRIAQFVAQEIQKDGKIPHATVEALNELIREASRRAKAIDGKDDALTLRLRELGGVVRAAGDSAVMEGSRFIEERHIRQALKRARPVEEQIRDKYGYFYKAVNDELTTAQRHARSEYWYENEVSQEGNKPGYG
ncbi:MAG: ATP-binding protein [Thermoplasmata archaeon YP2-bin.285]|uniref:ATP-binding protein n=1 Tax=Candidatus Sysuiplasma superficiale TaxID=2823368 RepID=A0A8J7YJI3_9ARCH|nr:ATP-binding protein [Candidatus Sysuiplasma superficiale]